MERYFEERVAPRLDAFERRIDKIEHRQHDLSTKLHTAPSVDMEITGKTPEFVLGAARQAYQLFGACTNFHLKTILNEFVETPATETTTAEGETNG